MSAHPFPVAIALRNALKKGYDFSIFKSDATAGLIVSLVALPLSMALSIAVGLPPQHGLYTAIVAGVIAALLGGSGVQVSGPTAAFVVIIAPIVSEHGLRGLIFTTIMAGLLLMAMGVARLGRYINYVPYPVTTGFTAGIAVVIGTLALNDLLGLNIAQLQGSYLHKLGLIAAHVPGLYWPEAVVGVVSLLVIFTAGSVLHKIPSPIVGIGVGTLVGYLLQQQGYKVATLGSRFSYTLPDGTLGHGIPPFAPSLHMPGFSADALFAAPTLAELQILFVPALIVAALGALESLLSATVADGIAGTKHHPNAELFGIGVANIFSAMAMGIPATGAIARTATNIHSGGRTPVASIIHALLLALYVVLLAPLLSYVPMASLAALLVHVAYRMSHWRQFVRMVRIAPRSDTLVLLACFGFTVLIDMVAGVTVGLVLACFLLVQRVASVMQAEVSARTTTRQQKIKHLNLPDDVLVYHIHGVLFFGTAEKALDRAAFIQGRIRTLVMDMEEVPLVDVTGLIALKTLILDVDRRGIRVIVCGQKPVTDRLLKKLAGQKVAPVTMVETIDDAVALIAQEV